MDDVMALYRAEFNGSADTCLYIDAHFDGLGSLREALCSGNGYLKYKRFYGVIEPGDSLTGDSDMPLLATPSLFDDNL